MTDEEFVLKNNNIKPNIVTTELKEGDKVWIVNTEGYLLRVETVDKIVKNYAYIKGSQYWRRGANGKHRKRDRYSEFAMLPHMGRKYVDFYPVDFVDDDCTGNTPSL